MPNFSCVAAFLCKDVTQWPVALQSKLLSDLQCYTKTGRLETIPKHARLLRISAPNPDQSNGGVGLGQDQTTDEELLSPTKKLSTASFDVQTFPYEVAVGMPWGWQGSCTCSWLFYKCVSFSPKPILAQEDIHLVCCNLFFFGREISFRNVCTCFLYLAVMSLLFTFTCH